MIPRKRPNDSLNTEEFVEWVKEAVKRKNAAEAIREAVKLLLAHYKIKQPEKKKRKKDDQDK